MSINDRIYEFEIQANQSTDLEFIFSPSEVASYDFDLPMLINPISSETQYAFNQYDVSLPNSVTPFQSELMASNRDKTPLTRKSSRASNAAQHILNKKVTAVGLRHALKLSNTEINFKIPIKYFENLKEGGFYEAKVSLRIFSFFFSKNQNLKSLNFDLIFIIVNFVDKSKSSTSKMVL